MARMYHPDLGREITVPDDDDCIAVHVDGGWEPAPEPEARPGYEPEPIVYGPVQGPLEDEVAELHERARVVELKVDRRWGIETLREKVAEAEAAAAEAD